jgi:hypothetical protein
MRPIPAALYFSRDCLLFTELNGWRRTSAFSQKLNYLRCLQEVGSKNLRLSALWCDSS